MPEFFPSFVPGNLPATDLGDFTRGYFGAAEWLLPEDEIKRDKIRGWSTDASRAMIRDCRKFYHANAADLAEYVAMYCVDMESAGREFYLSRNGHGAGFFDRGEAPVLDRLQDAARAFGEDNAAPYLTRRGFIEL